MFINTLKFILITFFLCLPTSIYAQGEAANWLYQGNILKFSTNSTATIPTIFPLPSSISQLSWGSSTIADKNGNLLFYSDGLNVYNNQHQIMENGGGLRSCAARTNCTTYQVVLIVPNPAAAHLYYLFQNDVYINGLFYSIIDMSQNNGKGKVIQKNIQIRDKIGQGMAVTIASDCQSYWLLTNDWVKPGYYYAYKITPAGIQPPIESSFFIKGGQDVNMYITFSNQGNKVTTIENTFFQNNSSRETSLLYDFNQQTGKLTNRINFNDYTSSFFGTVSFSPDGTKIYATSTIRNGIGLFQLDLSSNNETQIKASAIKIAEDSYFSATTIFHAANNGKLYFFKNNQNVGNNKNFVDVINLPNFRGVACNYQKNVFEITPTTIPSYGYGFEYINNPIFPSNFLGGVYKDFSFSQPCNTLTVNFAATSPNINDTYSWNFGDGTTATIQNPIKTYTQAGTYIVKLKIGACEFNKTVIVQKLATINLKPTLNLCHLEIGNFGINSETGFAYLWKPATGLSNPNIANPTFRLDNQGDTLKKITYKLLVSNSTTNCKDSSSITVSVAPALKPISAGKDTTICSNQSIRLAPQPPTGGVIGGGTPPVGGWGVYSWSPATGLDSANSLKPLLKLENNSNKTQKLTYILKATNTNFGNNCSISDTVIITVLPKIQAQIIGSSAVCPYSKNMIYKLRIPLTLEGGIKVLKWEIFGGTISPLSRLDSIAINWGTINDKAFVKVILQNELGCKDSVILNVKISPLTPEGGIKFAGADKNICYNESIEIGVKPLENYSHRWYKKNIEIDTLLLFSNTNIANPSIKNLTKNTKIVTHTYYVAVRNTDTGCEFLDSVLIKVFPKIEFYAAKDSLICSNTSLVLGSPPAPEGGVSWLWTLNNSTIKISEILSSHDIVNPTFSYINKTSKPIILRLALTTKHPNSECQKTDSTRITVLPTIKKYQIYGSSVICPNAKNITYKIDSLAADILQIFWFVKGGIIQKTISKDSIFVNFGNYNDKAFISAILQNDAGCHDTIKLDIKINQALKPSKPIGKTQICVNQGQNISYETNFTNGSSYEWFILGGDVISQNKNKVIVNWAKKAVSPKGEIGLVYVRENSVTQTDKCVGNSDTLQVKILASPDTTLQIIGDTSPCEFSQNITYQFGTNLSYNPNSKYVWTIENGEIIGQSLNIITVNWKSSELKNGSKNMGKITVLETFDNGCVGKLQSLEVALTSLEQCLKIPTLLTDKDSTFSFWRIIGLENYPNSEVIVYSLTGAKVYESSNYIQNFNFSTLASGVYVYVLQVRKGAEKVVFRGKMMVVR